MSLLRAIVPPQVAVHESNLPFPESVLLPQERSALGSCAPKRLQDFVNGRACAAAALAKLDYPQFPVLRGGRNEPLWPERVVGSITHCRGYAAAAVAHEEDIATIGIDAEEHDRLPEGTLNIIATDEECMMLRSLGSGGISWDRLLFSAKESLFKAWYPLEREWLGFDQARISFVPEHRQFTARVLRPTASPILRGVLTGTYTFDSTHVVTALVLPGR